MKYVGHWHCTGKMWYVFVASHELQYLSDQCNIRIILCLMVVEEDLHFMDLMFYGKIMKRWQKESSHFPGVAGGGES